MGGEDGMRWNLGSDVPSDALLYSAFFVKKNLAVGAGILLWNEAKPEPLLFFDEIVLYYEPLLLLETESCLGY